LCWLEWSAAPDRELLDPAGWAEANPALGLRVRPDQLAARAHADPEPVFRTEHLSQWVATTSAAIAPGTWHACRRDVALQRDWPSVLGVEVSFDRRHAAAVLAATDPEGVAHLRLLHAEHRPDGGVDLGSLAQRVYAYWNDGVAPRVAVDPRSAGPLVDHLRRHWHDPGKVLTTLGGGRLAGATAELLARAESGRLAHDGDELLTEHVLAAGVKPAGDGGLVLSRRASTGPIAAAVAAALAVHSVGEPVPVVPAIW
jgi:phage terminase large subunit-like protein